MDVRLGRPLMSVGSDDTSPLVSPDAAGRALPRLTRATLVNPEVRSRRFIVTPSRVRRGAAVDGAGVVG